MSEQVLLAAVFVLVSVPCMLLIHVLGRRGIKKRLQSVAAAPVPRAARTEARQWLDRVARAATPLARVSLPDEGWEASTLRRRFMQAGLRHPRAPVLFFAIKTLLGFCVPIALLFIWMLVMGTRPGKQMLMVMGLVCGAGFYAPNVVLNALIRARQKDIIEALPDAIDLLTICVEAGLSLDMAVSRVAREIELKSTTLAEELQLLVLELRAGYGRQVALANLALRAGVAELESLIKMLVQADRFGVSIGESLRTSSAMLRHKRQARAEERAAKVAVKLIFPLVLCIFPAILVVVGGPAMLRIMKVLPGLS